VAALRRASHKRKLARREIDPHGKLPKHQPDLVASPLLDRAERLLAAA